MPSRRIGGTPVSGRPTAPRVVSLVPGATEMLLALDAPATLVGRSHECDHPARAASAPALTSAPSVVGTSADIDAAVSSGQAQPGLDQDLLRRLDPDVVITQDLCSACAPGASEVAEACGPRTELVVLSPMRLDDVVDSAATIGAAIGAPEAGRRLAASLRERLDTCREAARMAAPVVTVCLEWLSPLYRAGHWIPDQVEAAGGVDPLGVAGTLARPIALRDVASAAPEVVVLMPCGWGSQEAWERAEGEGVIDDLAALPRQPRVLAADADAHFSRPGPRLVDGVEWLSAALGEGRRVRSMARTLR